MKTDRITIGASYAILEKDGKFLINRRCNTGYQDGMYQVPAGHIETGELPTEAMARELQEELGITVDPKDMQFVHVSWKPKHDSTGNRVDFFFLIKKWQGEVVNAEPHKCDDFKWVTFDKLPPNMSPYVRDAIKALYEGKPFQEFDMEYIRKNS